MPAEEGIAGRLHQPLPLDDPLPLVAEPSLAGERAEHGWPRLLDLQEQRVGLVPAEHQHDPAPGADAADADHLARDVGELGPVLVEQIPAVGGKRPLVAVDGGDQQLLDSRGVHVGGEQAGQRNHERRVGDDPRLAVDDPRQLVVRMAIRYLAAAARTMAMRPRLPMPLSLAAISRLAASRLTSHSHGPGSVSSKSLMSNTRRRSAEPNRPKLPRCASPHAWTPSPVTGVADRSRAIGSAAPRK